MPLAFTTGTSSHPKNTLQKRKFEIKILLLLQILIPGVMLSSLGTINPWLSACDLKQQGSSVDPRGSCSAPTEFPARTTPLPDVELLCPKECQLNESKTNASCLAYLDETRKSAICNFNLDNGIEWLKSFLGTIRLRHCCEYKIIESLSSSLLERVLRGKEECFSIIDSLVEVDNMAARVTCEFSEILSRYDCGQPYSVKFSCNDCLEAYRRWVCSTLVPFFNDSVRIRPCRSVCQAVEQKCPYFLPENKAPALPTQYAGEPTFLCMDPNIPETGEQQKRSLYPEEDACCVKICRSLKDGLCVEKGSKCKSEELISYEEAMDQNVECGPSEPYGPRVPSLECTASEPYSSPHKLGSGGSRTRSESVLLVLSSALLNSSHSHRLFIILVLCCFLLPFPFLQVLACLFADASRLAPLLTRLKPETKLFFHIVRLWNLIFNYFKFNSNKWQYYFILISVNLPYCLFIKNPEPLTTPSCLIDRFAICKSEKTRRARRYKYYYFYYNYYCYYKYYYTILSNVAQSSNDSDVEISRMTRDLQSHTFIKLAVKKSRRGKKLISVPKHQSLTINRINEVYTVIILKMILLKNFRWRRMMTMTVCRGLGEMAEASNSFPGDFCRKRTETTEDEDAASAFVPYVVDAAFVARGETSSSRLTLLLLLFAFVRDRGSQTFSRKHNKLTPKGEKNENDVENGLKIKLKLVKLCFLTRSLCSDPQCEFQTFSIRNLKTFFQKSMKIHKIY